MSWDYEDAILERQESEEEDCKRCPVRGEGCDNRCMEIEERFLNFETVRYEKRR